MIDRNAIAKFLNCSVLGKDYDSSHATVARLMCRCMQLVSEYLPPVGGDALQQATRFWLDQSLDGTSLEDARISCWRYLNSKHGNSTSIDDKEDAAMRALLCVLYEKPQSDEFTEESLYWFVDMFDRIDDYSHEFEKLIQL
ncbi:hypothetical protein ACN9MU_15265 [Pseudoduganella sp. R-32]|uniref:hypothetical protein n=1 Tax=Pseudoduganella sp. R-32 TaxID=3404061 RepID=UPI003CF18AD9